MAIIIELGNATMVDHNNYDLSLDEAAKELSGGRDVIALEFTDYSQDESFEFPQTDVLKAEHYKGKSIDEIIESIRCYYESFGRAS